MTDFENWQLLQGAVGNMIEQRGVMMSELATFFSLLFGYVIAAHLAGASLKKGHAILVTVFYLGTMFLFQWAYIGSMLIYADILEVVAKYRSEVDLPPARLPPQNPAPAIVTFAACNIALILGSIYYMWSVRRSTTK